ncbi:MAG TPA: DUF5615 family PIN-like protein [Chloroflexota bacterium]|nr:DUF5615 family PIN-like protein [Chloroflexota bacterium]
MKTLLDEMYPGALAEALAEAGIDAVTVGSMGLQGRPDFDVFAAAISAGRAVLTENVGDFAHIAADHSTSGQTHPGILIALSSRFSRRPGGRKALIAAILSVANADVENNVVYLRHPDQR